MDFKVEKRKMIEVDIGEYEHLLNCLANQKFIHEQTPEAQKDWQQTIDRAWDNGMQELSQQRYPKLVGE